MSKSMTLQTPLDDDLHDGKEEADQSSMLDEHSENPVIKSRWQIAMESMAYFATLSNVLRMGGAVGVAAAMGLFLADGLAVANDSQRFFTMLGLTGLLTLSGLAMLKLLKEPHGSRVFIALALFSVPINFTVVGALVYSITNFDALVTTYPGYAHWQVGSINDLLLAAGAGLAVVLPVTWFAVSVLARKLRTPLAAGLLLSSSLLLLPTRDEFWIAGVAFVAVLMLAWAYRKFANHPNRVYTLEERFAFILLLLPPVIMLARSFLLYESSTILFMALSAGLFWCSRQWRQQQLKQQRLETASSALAVIVTATAGMLTTFSAGQILSDFFPDQLGFIAMLLGLAVIIVDTYASPVHYRATRFISMALTAVLCVITAGHAILIPQLLTELASTGLLIALLAVFNTRQATTEMFMVAASIVLLLLTQAGILWNAAMSTGWWGIAIAGASAIVAGSLLERYGPIWKTRFSKTVVVQTRDDRDMETMQPM